MELKLCKIPTIGTQSENQTFPTGNISLGSPIALAVGCFTKAKNNTTQKTCSLKGFIAKIFKLSNIDVKSYGLGLHLFRHSFATFIYDETQDLVLTSRALGHNSLLSTKIYIHTTQEHNKKVALVLGGLLRNEKSE
ncbi:tyrosine-type recombinase/integrase [Helicobacter pylori]|uniref:tyrosine-type recombinase/integrase n=1 Tax=Helicobacter pylori TaxID=210 RepID=UPI003F5B1777